MPEQKPSLAALVSADVEALKRARHNQLLPHVFPHLFAVLGYRAANHIGTRGLGRVAHLLSSIVQFLTGAEISWMAEIGPGLVLDHPQGVILPDGLVAGSNLRVGAAVILGYVSSAPRSAPGQGCPRVGDDVEIWARATIVGPVQIGDTAIIGTCALVLDDVPAGAVARGIPARSYIDGVLVAKQPKPSTPAPA